MHVPGPWDMWRRCYFWRERERCEDGRYQIVWRQCEVCREETSILCDAISRIAEWKRRHPADAEAKGSCVCSYCGKLMEEAPHCTGIEPISIESYPREKRPMLCYNRGVWWMHAMLGEWWRRCYWWKEEHNAFRTRYSKVELRQCGCCRAEASMLRCAVRRITNVRQEAGRWTAADTGGESDGSSDSSDCRIVE